MNREGTSRLVVFFVLTCQILEMGLKGMIGIIYHIRYWLMHSSA